MGTQAISVISMECLSWFSEGKEWVWGICFVTNSICRTRRGLPVWSQSGQSVTETPFSMSRDESAQHLWLEWKWVVCGLRTSSTTPAAAVTVGKPQLNVGEAILDLLLHKIIHTKTFHNSCRRLLCASLCVYILHREKWICVLWRWSGIAMKANGCVFTCDRASSTSPSSLAALHCGLLQTYSQ